MLCCELSGAVKRKSKNADLEKTGSSEDFLDGGGVSVRNDEPTSWASTKIVSGGRHHNMISDGRSIVQS